MWSEDFWPPDWEFPPKSLQANVIEVDLKRVWYSPVNSSWFQLQKDGPKMSRFLSDALETVQFINTYQIMTVVDKIIFYSFKVFT